MNKTEFNDFNSTWDEILDEFEKLNKIGTAIQELGEIVEELSKMGCPQQLSNKMSSMIENWKKLYWFGNLANVNFDEILVKLKKIKENNKK